MGIQSECLEPGTSFSIQQAGAGKKDCCIDFSDEKISCPGCSDLPKWQVQLVMFRKLDTEVRRVYRKEQLCKSRLSSHFIPGSFWWGTL